LRLVRKRVAAGRAHPSLIEAMHDIAEAAAPITGRGVGKTGVEFDCDCRKK
jgi:hypothetical protein